MLIGWECIGCQSEYRIHRDYLGKPGITPPEKCGACEGTVFRRLEQGVAETGLYPERKAESGLPMRKADDAADRSENLDHTLGDWLGDGGFNPKNSGVSVVQEMLLKPLKEQLEEFDRILKKRLGSLI